MKPIVFLILLCALSGCYDTFYGPKLRNGFDSEIEVKVIFTNGEIFENVWPPCLTAFVGKGSHPDSVIKEIIIKRQQAVIYQLGSEQILEFSEKERKNKGYSVWNIDSEGIHFVTVQLPYDCK